MSQLHCTELHAERGLARLIVIVLLLLSSAIGIASLQHAQDEATGGGRSRHHARNLHAADGVLEVVIAQLLQEDALNKQSPVDFTNFIQSPETGAWTAGKTGLPDSTVAAPIRHCGTWVRSGDAMGGAVRRNIYCVDILASDSGGRVGLQAQYGVLDASGGNVYR